MSNFELQLGFDAKILAKESPNKNQLKAIKHKTGPLLVVAGAGTGKTRVITERIAWIIENNLAKPEEVLALTFTEKAAGEMEIRVDQLLPYGLTNTNIFTFHSFCDSILRELTMEANLAPEFKILSDKESELLMRDRITEIEGIEELRPVKNPSKYINEILRVISRAKDELISCEEYQELISKLPKDNSLEIKRQQEIAKIYSHYEEWKQEIGALDFGDLITILVNTIKTNPEVKKNLQNRFKFILIDEFQDTNKAQYELVKSLLGKQKNLTVVGDDDQSIYAFRGAALNNILGFIEDFPDSKVVTLTENYRSTQNILDKAYYLIQKNNPERLEEKLQINKRLQALSEGTEATFHWYQQDTDELVSLAKKIKERAQEIPYNNMAILVRSNSSAEAITRVLDLEQIPYITNFDNAFYFKSEIAGAIAFFRVLKNPNDSDSLMRLAVSPFYEIPVTEFFYILDNAKKTHRSIDEIIRDKNSVAWNQVSKESQKLIRSMTTELDELRELIKTHNAGEILYEFLQKREFLQKEKLEIPGHQEAIQNIMVIFSTIKNWLDIGGNPFAPHFINELETILKNITPPNFDGAGMAEAIQVLTIHASKGLEFDTVFLPMMVSDRFPSRMRRNSLNLLDLEKQLPEAHLQEERRLAYVALTRAKKHLVVSGAQYYGASSRAKKPSQFIMEALNLEHIPAAIEAKKSTSPITFFSPKKPIKVSLKFPAFDGVITLSPSMIESYLKCPYEFYWRYVLKAPSKANHHLIYGSAIHSGIETFFKTKGTQKEKTEAAIEAFNNSWREEGFPNAKVREELKAQGIKSIYNFCEAEKDKPAPTEIEKTFVLNLGDVRVKGRIDAFYDNPTEIRDFKTSQIKDEKDAMTKLKSNFPLKVYALAISENLGKPPEKLSLNFVDFDTTVSYQPKEKDLEKVKEKILNAAQKIKEGNFEPAQSEHFCDVCGKI